MDTNPRACATLALAAAGREVADAAYATVVDTNQPTTTADRIKRWRDIRLLALAGQDRATLLGLISEGQALADRHGLSTAELCALEDTLVAWEADDAEFPMEEPTYTALVELIGVWDMVASAYGLTAPEMRARFGKTLAKWRRGEFPEPGALGEFSTGMPWDVDPLGTAESLDTWIARHAELWFEDAGKPVMRAILA